MRALLVGIKLAVDTAKTSSRPYEAEVDGTASAPSEASLAAALGGCEASLAVEAAGAEELDPADPDETALAFATARPGTCEDEP